MEPDDLAKITSLFLLGTVKFMWAPAACIAAGYTLFQTIVLTSSGGITGITTFYFFGTFVNRNMNRLRSRKRRDAYDLRKKIFSRRSRSIVRFKASFGLIGLAIVTPAILSIPIGSVLAAKFFSHNRLTYPLLLLSTVLWSAFLSVFSAFLKGAILGL